MQSSPLSFDDLLRRQTSRHLWTHRFPRVAIIGGGIGGLAMCRALVTEGITPILLERRDELGGIWSSTKHFAAYGGLVQNTSARQMELDGLSAPPPSSGHHYSREEYAGYVQDYANTLGRDGAIFVDCEVRKIARCASGVSLSIVSIAGTSRRHVTVDANHVVYAGGSHHRPHMAQLSGLRDFRGLRIHSSQLDDCAHLRGLNVVIVGFGNTAADVAVRLSSTCRSVSIACRNPTWVVPRLIDGKATDALVSSLYRRLGSAYTAELYQPISLSGGFLYGEDQAHTVDYKRHRIVTSTEILPLLHDGSIEILPRIEKVGASRVRFENGRVRDAEALVFCTGYQVSPPALEGVDYSVSPLIANLLHTEWSRFWFVGLTPIWGSAAAIAKRQARVVATAIADRVGAPELRHAAGMLPKYDRADAVLPFGFEVVEFNSYAEYLDALLEALVRRRRRLIPVSQGHTSYSASVAVARCPN